MWGWGGVGWGGGNAGGRYPPRQRWAAMAVFVGNSVVASTKQILPRNVCRLQQLTAASVTCIFIIFSSGSSFQRTQLTTIKARVFFQTSNDHSSLPRFPSLFFRSLPSSSLSPSISFFLFLFLSLLSFYRSLPLSLPLSPSSRRTSDTGDIHPRYDRIYPYICTSVHLPNCLKTISQQPRSLSEELQMDLLVQLVNFRGY